MRGCAFFLTMFMLIGCDSDPSTPDAGVRLDTGTTDAGADAATPISFQYRVRVIGVESNTSRAGLEGVQVLVDTDVGRVEAITGADGTASVAATTLDGRFDVLLLRAGWLVLSVPDRAVDTIGSEPEDQALHPFPIEPVFVEATVSATNMPAGGSWCLGAGQWQVRCQSTVSIVVNVPAVTFGGGFTALAIDADGVVTDFVEGELTGDAPSATVTFDDSPDLPLSRRTVELALPTDPESPYSDPADLPASWTGFVAAVGGSGFLMRSAVTNVEATSSGTGLTMDLTTAAMVDETLSFALAIYPTVGARVGVRTFRWFSAPPTESTFTFLDAPRPLSEGMPLDSLVSWTPVSGATSYSIQVEVDDQIGLRVITAGTSARLPVLPDGFDDSAIFPPGEEWAVLRPVAVAGQIPPGPNPDAPYGVDGQLARGLPFSLAR